MYEKDKESESTEVIASSTISDLKFTSFENAKNNIQAFANRNTADFGLATVPSSGGLFKLGDHKVTGDELNNITSQVQGHLVKINGVTTDLIKEFGQVYTALESLDKEYIPAILSAVKGAETASNQAKNAAEHAKVAQEDIRKTVKEQKKIIKVLEDHKAKLDKLKHLDYHSVVSHQCACIWLFPHSLMLPVMTGKKAQKRSEKLARQIGEDVLNKVRSPKRPSAPVLNRIESAAWPKLAEIKAQKLTVSGKCSGCGQCERLCPKGNIRLSGGRPVFGDKCIQCLSCLQYCPTQAIHMGGVTVGRERYHNPNINAAELNESIIHID